MRFPNQYYLPEKWQVILLAVEMIPLIQCSKRYQEKITRFLASSIPVALNLGVRILHFLVLSLQLDSFKYYAQFYCISISLKIMQVYSQISTVYFWVEKFNLR